MRVSVFLLPALMVLTGCAVSLSDVAPEPASAKRIAESARYFGTTEPMAEHAIYFLLTDRFVNGDSGNDHRGQGGDFPTWHRPMAACDGVSASLGYRGGDFRGLLDNADYIREMGFGAVWITPIADNPDQFFTGGDEPACDSILTDQGKTGYHGYWATNFYRTDEHLPSEGLGFAELTAGLRQAGLLTVLDIVGNHGSPGWSMSAEQAAGDRVGFGQIFDADGRRLADHQNLAPEALRPGQEPLHAFFRTRPSLAQLASLDADNPALVDYLSEAYLRWIDQGAAAFRVDTIAYMPPSFWAEIAQRIDDKHPGFFRFGEVFSEDAAEAGSWTRAERGGYSVLDFPLHAALRAVFEHNDSDYAELADALHLDGGPYRNVYELVTFYDNHDMPRLNGGHEGLINAHNWLFTARGIPVVYYGSEAGFMPGRREHAGNRNYFGIEGIDAAREHPVRQSLMAIARLRVESPALQKGVQLMLELGGDRAAFYRVYQNDGVAQIALVLLNKGSRATRFRVERALQAGAWREPLRNETRQVNESDAIEVSVAANGVSVWLLDAAVDDQALIDWLEAQPPQD